MKVVKKDLSKILARVEISGATQRLPVKKKKSTIHFFTESL